MNTKEIKRISKFMSLVLRHQPDAANLKLDENGWVAVPKLLLGMKAKGYRVNMEELEQIVRENDKQRFTFNENKTQIRANQGHSIQVDLQLNAIEPPEELYHGTVARFLSSIYKEGLTKRKRHHLHLSEDRNVAVQVGQRRGEEVILIVASGEMHRDGYQFYNSKNQVWLTDHVPAKYIRQRRGEG